ncbi:MAG: AtpZ/AtpI family protein [Alphaproteobacteria bacterium]|nr:AtpZ/AtpI family protein [Alphaproteobacteria bacterium]
MNELPQDIKDIDERIRNLKNAKKEEKKSQTSILMQQAFRFAAEFISPVIIALALGYSADKVFETRPIIMLILAGFGCVAGVLNVYKAALETDKDIR